MLSHRPWTLDSAVRLLLFFFVGLSVVGLLGTGVRLLLKAQPEPIQQLVTQSVTTLLMHGLVFGLVIWFVRDNRLSFQRAFGLERPGLGRAVAAGILALVVVFPVALGLQWTTQQFLIWRAVPVVAQPAVKMLAAAHAPWERVLMAVQTVVTAPLAEELFFRGILYVSIKQAGFPRIAFYGVGLLFGLSHLSQLTFLPLVFFGLVLAWLYERTDSLAAPVAAHATFNAINFAWVMLS